MAKFLIVLFIFFLFPNQAQASEVFGRISTNPQENDFVNTKIKENNAEEINDIKITREIEKSAGENVRSWLDGLVKIILTIIKWPEKIWNAISYRPPTADGFLFENSFDLL